MKTENLGDNQNDHRGSLLPSAFRLLPYPSVRILKINPVNTTQMIPSAASNPSLRNDNSANDFFPASSATFAYVAASFSFSANGPATLKPWTSASISICASTTSSSSARALHTST